MSKFYAVKLFKSNDIASGYLGFDNGWPVATEIRSAAFYDEVDVEDCEYDAVKFSQEHPEYTARVIMVEIEEVALWKILTTTCKPDTAFLYGGNPAIYFSCPHCNAAFSNYDAKYHLATAHELPKSVKFGNWDKYLDKYCEETGLVADHF